MCQTCVVEYDKEPDPEKRKSIGNIVVCPACGTRMIIKGYGYPAPGLVSCMFACCTEYFCPTHHLEVKQIPCKFVTQAA